MGLKDKQHLTDENKDKGIYKHCVKKTVFPNTPKLMGKMVKVKRAFSLTWISKQRNYGLLHGCEC